MVEEATLNSLSELNIGKSETGIDVSSSEEDPDQICDRGQKHCDHEMSSNHWGGRHHGHGWESNKSSIRHQLIERDQHGRGHATGWRGPVDSVRLISRTCCCYIVE